MIYEQIRRAQQNSEYRRVKIEEVNMARKHILARDRYEREYQISYDFHFPILTIPRVGEIWLIKSYGNDWRLDKVATPRDMGNLQPGDIIIEGDKVYIDGTTIIINGTPVDPATPIFPNIQINGTLVGSKPTINFIAVDNIELSGSVDETLSRVDILLTGEAGGGSTGPSTAPGPWIVPTLAGSWTSVDTDPDCVFAYRWGPHEEGATLADAGLEFRGRITGGISGSTVMTFPPEDRFDCDKEFLIALKSAGTPQTGYAEIDSETGVMIITFPI